jgi:predicted metalloprotease with PDZ domain
MLPALTARITGLSRATLSLACAAALAGLAAPSAFAAAPDALAAAPSALAAAPDVFAAAQAPNPVVSDAPYAAGELKLHVDATDIAHRVFRVHEEIPVSGPGPLRLYYPQWLPGNHGPRGPVDEIGGLTFTANGRTVPWKRDPLDMYSFLVDVPQGASSLTVEFQHLSPLDSSQGRVVMTPEIIGLQWNAVSLYPAGYKASNIMIRPSVTLPAGWGFGTALDGEGDASAIGAKAGPQKGGTINFNPINFDDFIDSPLLAGKYYKRFVLKDGPRPVYLDTVADTAKELDAKPEILAKHKVFIQQADKLYKSQHYKHYHFLFSISERYAGIGLEHHQSSEDGARPGYLIDAKKPGSDLLPHEYTHSWNGKFRRGADLATPNFNVPMQDSLLWVYEGQTQYWGNVLAVRSGLRTQEAGRDALASVAAGYDNRDGRLWRPLIDTTNQPIISPRAPQGWSSWQRSEDYYTEGELIWLDADTLIREKSGGKKSLDDFASSFFGVDDGRIDVLTYTFDDVVAGLNAVLPYDWKTFLDQRVNAIAPKPPLDGLARAGWKLVYTAEENAASKAAAMRPGGGGGANLSYSLGLSVDKENKINSVLWNSVAFKAGLAPGMVIVGVNDEAASADRLKDAVTAAKGGTQPIELLVNSFDHLSTIKIDYHGGLRYPHLERIEKTPDLLTAIHDQKK